MSSAEDVAYLFHTLCLKQSCPLCLLCSKAKILQSCAIIDNARPIYPSINSNCSKSHNYPPSTPKLLRHAFCGPRAATCNGFNPYTPPTMSCTAGSHCGMPEAIDLAHSTHHCFNCWRLFHKELFCAIKLDVQRQKVKKDIKKELLS